MSPTQRSTANLRSRGWTVAIVEKWNPHVRIRQDVFGFGDLLACGGIVPTGPASLVAALADGGIALVQTTTGPNVAARRAKILAEPRARAWLEAGGRILLHGWRKTNDRVRGARKTWKLSEEEVTLADFDAASVVTEPAWADEWRGEVPTP